MFSGVNNEIKGNNTMKDFMKKSLHDKVLIIISTIAWFLLVFCICCINSDVYMPFLYIALACMVWLVLFAIANNR